MIKKIFAPIQALILQQGKCVGCGKSLKLARKFKRGDNKDRVVCICSRVFIFNKTNGKYRRANFDEATI